MAVIILCILGFSNRPALAKQESSLRGQVQNLVQEYQDPQVSLGLWIEDLGTGKKIFSQNPDLPLIPASNQKLLLILLALKELGPQYRFSTRFLGPAPDGAGQISSLTLRGGGDPTLSTMNLWQMAAALKARGIRRVERLYLDDTLFPMGDFPGQLHNSQVDAAFNAPVGALAVDQNLITLIVSPGAKAGAAARLELDPPLPGFPLENQSHTEGKKPKLLIRNLRENPEDERLLIRGSIPAGAGPQIFHLAQAQPRKMVARRLLQALDQAGIEHPETVEWVTTPASGNLLLEHSSPPLEQILQLSGKESNNFVTEQILKTLAALKTESPGTTEAGVVFLEKMVKQWNLPGTGIHMENASGLSRENRLTVHVLAEALKRGWNEPLIRENFLSSLSVLGVDGTLKDKFFDKGLEGHFRGKTGTLSGVTSLAGIVIPKRNPKQGPLLLAVIANGNGRGFWRQLQFQQKLLELLIQTP